MSKKVSSHLRDISEKLGLKVENGEIIETTTPNGDKIVIIKRQGYRRIVSQQPDYIKHIIYPIYPGTEIEISNNDEIHVRMDGDMSNITGALGVLYKQDVPGFFMYHVSMSDYEYKIIESDEWWMRMSQTMLMKTCETALIRMAYPAIFSGIYFEEDDPGKPINERKETINYLRSHMSMTRDFLPSKEYALENLKIEELRELKQKVDKKVSENESNSKDKKH